MDRRTRLLLTLSRGAVRSDSVLGANNEDGEIGVSRLDWADGLIFLSQLPEEVARYGIRLHHH